MRLALTALLLAASFAEPLQAKDLIVGQVATFTDTRSTVAMELQSGIELQFEMVNRAGGIHGATLKLMTKDRSTKIPEAVAATREFLKESQPTALIGLMGTGPTEALVREKVLSDAAVPVVGIRSGATSLHSPVNPWLFHTRAPYSAEAEKIVQSLSTIGYKKFAVFHEDTPFGEEGLKHVMAALKARSLPLVSKGTVPRDSTEVAKAVADVSAAVPDAVVAVGTSDAVADFYKAFRKVNKGAMVVALSTVDGGAVVKRIGKLDAHGLGLARVVPDPQNRRSPLVREFQDNGVKLRGAKFNQTQAALEGYVAAKVLVEALRRAGPNPTPVQVKASLETIKGLDAGGLFIGFTPAKHSGSDYVDVGIMGPEGRMLH